MPVLNTLRQSATVLVVDNDREAGEQLRHSFESHGYRTLAAEDARSAILLLQHERCDLVLLNLELPRVDGLKLCRVLRAQPSTSKLPIIAMSEDDNGNQKAQAFAAGADDFIPRNASATDILSRSAAHLRAAQRERALIGSNRELRFLADLGRGLLRALEPEQLVRRVAGATYEGTSAALCAAFVKLKDQGEAACVFDREGSAEDSSMLRIDLLQSWLSSANPASSRVTNRDRFFLRDDNHHVEYAAPLTFGGRANGALIVGFDRPEDCDDTVCRLVEAAAQQTSLAAHISTLYQAARQISAGLTVEVERRTAEVEAQRRFIEAIIDGLPLSLYVIDRDYNVVAWNRNRELGELGIPRGSVLGKNIFSVLTRQKRELLEPEFARVFETGEIQRIEHESTTPNGRVRYWLISKIPMWIDRSGQVSHVITVGEDISARVEANRAVARAEKLAAVGRLAAGVVHEINNPLATISACAESLESRLKEGAFAESDALEDFREYLGLIRSEAFRCKSITNGLLDFSRTRTAEHSTLNLVDVISSATRLLAHQQRGGGINFQENIPDDLPPVSGDPGQLQQVIIALSTNAVDAMPDGGVLSISAESNGSQVLVSIRDTGIGIPPEHLTKIFEPFFTTKEVGKGTGLGLAVCYGILTEHGGSLDVQSAVGIGTTFTISLPAVRDAEEG
ncbi:MAG TPA: ATP-binding protein [Pyrinomonadaceae bacterium]|nr:ATP-binding protein [Pyrinomonadaceae bacterium]